MGEAAMNLEDWATEVAAKEEAKLEDTEVATEQTKVTTPENRGD